MAMNLLRFKPRDFCVHVQRVMAKKLVSAADSKLAGKIIEKLKNLESMSTLKFNAQANQAVLANNEEIIARAEAVPAEGGNLDKL